MFHRTVNTSQCKLLVLLPGGIVGCKTFNFPGSWSGGGSCFGFKGVTVLTLLLISPASILCCSISSSCSISQKSWLVLRPTWIRISGGSFTILREWVDFHIVSIGFQKIPNLLCLQWSYRTNNRVGKAYLKRLFAVVLWIIWLKCPQTLGSCLL